MIIRSIKKKFSRTAIPGKVNGRWREAVILSSDYESVMSGLHAAVELARSLGRIENDLAILAEGNTSAKEDDNSFWVKASGFNLRELTVEQMVQVAYQPILDSFNQELDDGSVRTTLASAKVKDTPLAPSVETFMHAYLLTLPEVTIVGHTHPTPLLSLLSIDEAPNLAKRRLFPDDVVCCGPATVFVPYCDPGVPLARTIKQGVENYIREWEAIPKTIWLQNHGLIALGKSVAEVETASFMSVKAARIWLGALGTGKSLVELTEKDISRIHTRPDEHYRQRILAALAGSPASDRS